MEKIPEPGDFSKIIKDAYWCYILTNDYKIVFGNKHYINILINKKNGDDGWDTPPPGDLFMQILCKCHIKETFKKSLNILTYIALNGWEAYFLLNYIPDKSRKWCCFQQN